jgi:hypothetical protein
MKCEIQWIDAKGIATPDENEAIGVARCRNHGKLGTWGEPIPICQAHATRLVPYHVSWPGTDHGLVTEWKLELS